MTFKALILESSVISVSCMPETKYSWSGLPERLSSGNTAIESIVEFCLGERYCKTTMAIVMKINIDEEINLTDFFLNKEKKEDVFSVLPCISLGNGITNPSFDAAKTSTGCCT